MIQNDEVFNEGKEFSGEAVRQNEIIAYTRFETHIFKTDLVSYEIRSEKMETAWNDDGLLIPDIPCKIVGI